MDWIIELFEKFNASVDAVYESLVMLPSNLNQIIFDEYTSIYKFFGLIHYVLGSPLYTLFSSAIMIGAGFVMYRMAKALLNLLQILIPALKGKIHLP